LFEPKLLSFSKKNCIPKEERIIIEISAETRYRVVPMLIAASRVVIIGIVKIGNKGFFLSLSLMRPKIDKGIRE
jgi:hypothetical protein